MIIELGALVLFSIIIALIFYRILTTTRSLLIFLSILFATFVIFRYVIQQSNIIYDEESTSTASCATETTAQLPFFTFINVILISILLSLYYMLKYRREKWEKNVQEVK